MYKKEFITTDPLLKDYQIDTDGNIFSKRGRIMHPSRNGRGYVIESFVINDKRISRPIHRLVAKQFIPNPLGKETVNHKDGDPGNNKVENLEWGTPSEQMRHSFDVLGRSSSLATRLLGTCLYTGDMNLFSSYREAARFLGIRSCSLIKALNGKNGTCRGYSFEVIK